ncbi:MAG: hypothetical protein AB1571_02740 [Nanoarchaeota archaeon]
MLFEKKRKKEFVGLLKSAYCFIDQGKFDEATAIYHKISIKFELLPRAERTNKLRRDIERLSLELVLYMKINEASMLAKSKKLKQLEQKLNEIRIMLNEVAIKSPDSIKLIRYADKYYRFYSDIYKKRCYETNFYAKLRKINNLIKRDKISAAIKEYHNLLQYYKVLLMYKDVTELRPILDSLLDTLEIKKLEKQARENIKPIKIKIPEIKEDVYIPKRRIKITKTTNFSPIFKDLYNLIKNNKYQEAVLLFDNV